MKRVTAMWSVLVLAALPLRVAGEPKPSPPSADPATAKSFSFLVVSGDADPHDDAFGQWLARQAGQPQAMPPFDLTAPAPSFVLETGSASGADGRAAATATRPSPVGLPIPVHRIVADGLRSEGAKTCFSFGAMGCHFVGFSAIGGPGPLATLDARTIYWLREELAKVGVQTPVFIICHRRPDDPVFARPAEWSRLYATLARYNVALLLTGGGTAVHTQLDGIDVLGGGATNGDGAGCTVVSIHDGHVRAIYRPLDPRKPVQKLLEKPLKPGSGPGLSCSLRSLMPAVRGGHFALRPRLRGGSGKTRYTVSIDGQDVPFTQGNRGDLKVPTRGLSIGGHTLELRAAGEGGQPFIGMTTGRFYFDDRSIDVAWRRYLPSSVLGCPLPVERGNVLLVPETGGVLRAIHRKQTSQVWEFKTGGPIAGSPLSEGGAVFFGSGDGFVYCLDHNGKEVWKYNAGGPVLGTAVMAENTLYIGDEQGRLHAIGAWTGRKKWITQPAGGAIVVAPTLADGRVWYGTVNGMVGCVDAATGKLVRKTPGPSGQAGGGQRRLAPILCSPVAYRGSVLVCDADGVLGGYKKDVEAYAAVAEGIVGIAASPDGESYYARGLGNRVMRFDGSGGSRPTWEATVPTGRLPIPPTVAHDRVYVCSDTGLVSVLDAGSGAVQWQYQATPGSLVMAPVAVDAAGDCYPVGMDGTLTRIRGKAKGASTAPGNTKAD